MSRFDWLELGAEGKNEAGPLRQSSLSSQPRDATSYYQAGRKLREAGHLKSAVDYYRHSVGLDERNYAATTEMIDTQVRAGMLDEADRSSAEALEQYKQVPLFYASRALVLAHRGEMIEAWPLCQIAMDHSAHWYIHFVHAELQLRAARENLPEVVEALDTLVERHAELWELHFLSAWMLLEAECAAHAAAFAAEAAHLRPRSAAAWICLGDSFLALRLYDQAQFYYQRAIELEMDHPLALERLRQCSGLHIGLMRLFTPADLRRRWAKKFEQERS